MPETIEGLRADLDTLSAVTSDRRAVKTRQKGRTGHERVIAMNGHDWVMSICEMAKRTPDPKRTPDLTGGELKSIGVGETIHPKSTDQVTAAIKACLQAFADTPDLASKIGVLDADATEGSAIIADLRTAGGNQTEVMTESKDKTFDRNAVQLRIESAVDMISSRGAMDFRLDLEIRDRFSALVSSSGPAMSENANLDAAAEG